MNIDKILKEKGGIRLDIGGGGNPQEGFVNIDYRGVPGVDIVHNLEKFPWPLPDECVSVAVCSHVVEHINPAGGTFIEFLNEAWRVLKYGSQLAIVTPYAGSPGYWQDPTHCNGCTEITFSYFDPLDSLTDGALYRIYEPAPWEIESRTWHRSGNLEVILKKRRDDKTYHSDGKIRYGI